MTSIKKSNGYIKHFINSEAGNLSFFYVPDGTAASSLSFTDEEEVRTAAWYPYVKKDDVVIDVGAGYLSYTLPALAAGAIVYAFSPEHEKYMIQKSVDANSEKGFGARCHLYDFGLYSKKGFFKTDTAQFFKNNEITETQILNTNTTSDVGWYIPVITLDEFMQTHGSEITKIDMIKIDTEGAEVEILKGGINTIKKFRPRILVEYHNFKDNTLRKRGDAFLKELGYEYEMAMDITRPDLPHILYVYNNESSSK